MEFQLLDRFSFQRLARHHALRGRARSRQHEPRHPGRQGLRRWRARSATEQTRLAHAHSAQRAARTSRSPTPGSAAIIASPKHARALSTCSPAWHSALSTADRTVHSPPTIVKYFFDVGSLIGERPRAGWPARSQAQGWRRRLGQAREAWRSSGAAGIMSN